MRAKLSLFELFCELTFWLFPSPQTTSRGSPCQRSPIRWRVTSTELRPVASCGCYRPVTPRCFKKRRERPTRSRSSINKCVCIILNQSFEETIIHMSFFRGFWVTEWCRLWWRSQGGWRSFWRCLISAHRCVSVVQSGVGVKVCPLVPTTGASGRPRRTEWMWDFRPTGFSHSGINHFVPLIIINLIKSVLSYGEWLPASCVVCVVSRASTESWGRGTTARSSPTSLQEETGARRTQNKITLIRLKSHIQL